MPEIPYTVRLAPKLLELIEKAARERGISPRKLIRAVLVERFANEGSAARAHHSRGHDRSAEFDQILFDVTRTRLTLQHLLDYQAGSETTDRIRRAAQQEAEQYLRMLRTRWS